MTAWEPPTTVTVQVDATPKDAAVLQKIARRSRTGRRYMWQVGASSAVGFGLLAITVLTASGTAVLAGIGAYIALAATFQILNRQHRQGIATSASSTTYVLDPISVAMSTAIGKATGSVSVRWQDLIAVTETEGHLVLHFEEIRLGIIPRRCFRRTEDEQQVIQWIREARRTP